MYFRYCAFFSVEKSFAHLCFAEWIPYRENSLNRVGCESRIDLTSSMQTLTRETYSDFLFRTPTLLLNSI